MEQTKTKYYRITLESRLSDNVFSEELIELRMAQLKNLFGDSAVIGKVECDENGNLLSLSKDAKETKPVDVATQIVEHYIEHEVKHQS